MAGIPNPTEIPSQLVAGDTLKFKITNSEFLASADWTYNFVLINATTRLGPFASTADGDSHQVTVEEGVTATWAAGEYRLQAYYEHTGGDRFTTDFGNFEVLHDVVGDTSATDLRSHAKIALDAIEAVMESRATIDQMEFQIAGRSLKRMEVGDLIKFREYYRGEVRSEKLKEDIADGKSSGNQIRTRFPN